jgi:hypothetical protein
MQNFSVCRRGGIGEERSEKREVRGEKLMSDEL